jgi:hypothetical protein
MVPMMTLEIVDGAEDDVSMIPMPKALESLVNAVIETQWNQ